MRLGPTRRAQAAQCASVPTRRAQAAQCASVPPAARRYTPKRYARARTNVPQNYRPSCLKLGMCASYHI
eukprot:2593652-Prymnesium_polylepis.1